MGEISTNGAATATVIDWAVNDQPVYDRLRAILKGEDGYRGPWARKRLGALRDGSDAVLIPAMADFVGHLLYEDDGSMYRSLYRKAGRGDLDTRIPGAIREELDMDGVPRPVPGGIWAVSSLIDWQAVAGALTRGDA